jgi:glycerate 2-kinase
VQEALASAEPGLLVERALDREPLTDGPIRLLAVGKAAAAMTAGALRRVGNRVVAGIVIGPSDAPAPARFLSIRGNHPVPGEGSERAGRAALALVSAGVEERREQSGIVLVLLSGGASALMAVPAEGLTLEDKQQTTNRLLKAGVPIGDLNAVRKHLSAVKGGQLAVASRLPVVTLAISDVVGDDPTVIGSGPTVADTSRFEDALGIVMRAGGRRAFPEAVVARLEAGAEGRLVETPKPGDPRLARSQWTCIGGRFDAMGAAARAAEARGYVIEVQDAAIVGDAREAAGGWVERLTGATHRPGRMCLITSGETTVTVTGTGRGGRNQEFALAAAEALGRLDRPAALASVGTDGIDGPTDAAGAIVRSDTMSRALAAGLAPPAAFLAANDSYSFFSPLGDLIKSGPTGTNVGDLQICLIG